jgi:hypothetical protein
MVKKQISKLLIISMQLIIFCSCERITSQKVIGLTKDEVSKLIPKEINTDLWIFDKIIKKTNNSDIDSIKHKMSNLKISIRKDTLYLDNKYKFHIKEEKISSKKYFRYNYLYNFYTDFFKNNYGIDIKYELNYLQFYGVKNNYIKNYLTELYAAIYMNDHLFLDEHDYIVSYVKPYGSNDLAKIFNDLKELNLPINSDIIQHDEKFSSIPKNFQTFFQLENLDDYSALKLPFSQSNIQTIIVSAYQEVGEKDLYLYTLSKKGEILDKLSLFSIEGETEQGENVGNIFNIDKNYKIKITTTLQNEKKIVKNYKINDLGKFIELKK